MGFLALARQVSAVTAACMALPKDVFEAVGGMDADNLSAAYNDVDLCLRIRARGLSVMWTPFAELYHLARHMHLLIYYSHSSVYCSRPLIY
jgi:O-antigen biosynthesis protein